MATTVNEVLIDAPIGFVWAITNDVRGWTDLFTEYAAVEVLDTTGETIRFRLTMHPDAEGRTWSWVSERTPDQATWTVSARRIETGPFEYMRIGWECEEVGPAQTRMRWRQEFTMRPDAPIDDAGMTERLNHNTVIQQAVIKQRIEDRRRAVVDFADVPANRRRGGDVRTLLSPGTVGSTSGFTGAVRLAPGELVTEHYHPYSEEFLFVVEGELRVDLEGEGRLLRANQAAFVPMGVRHRLVNVGDTPALVAFFLSPLAPRPELGHMDTETLEDALGGLTSAARG